MFQQIRLPQAHTISRNFGAGVKIAVIDPGIDLAHPLFTGRLAPSTEWKDFVDGDATPQEVAGTFYGHGTGIAGLIAQTAPRATILPIRVLESDGTGDVANIVLAIDWAIQKGANVINLSLGTDTHVASFEQAVTYATQMGVYIVAAAGNEGSVNTLLYPAEYTANNHKMFSVGSFSSALLLSLFSNSSSKLEYVAPGEFLTSAYPDMRVAQYTGSSFATPIVAGAVALAQGDANSADKQSVETYLFLGSEYFGVNMGRRIDVTNLLRNVPGFVSRQALFVASSTTLTSGDTLLKSRLEGMGYTVTVKTHSVVAADASGKDVVFISSSVDASKLAAKLRDVATPVVVARFNTLDDMKMTGTGAADYGSMNNYSSVLVSSTHPIASGLTNLLATPVYSAAGTTIWGKPGSSAIKIASYSDNTERVTMFAYDKDAAMVGLTAPARRVGTFHNHAASAAIFGWQLFESAISWATSGN
jgi:hypothetical protein